MKQPTPVWKLIHRLRLMAETGGMITRDRRNVIIESADMLEELDERVSIMMEGNNIGGDANEKH